MFTYFSLSLSVVRRTQGAHVKAPEGALRAFSATASIHQRSSTQRPRSRPVLAEVGKSIERRAPGRGQACDGVEANL